MRVLPYGQRQERSGLDPVLSLVGHRNARHKVTTQDYEGSSYRHSRNIGDGRISKVGCVAVRKQGLTMAATTERAILAGGCLLHSGQQRYGAGPSWQISNSTAQFSKNSTATSSGRSTKPMLLGLMPTSPPLLEHYPRRLIDRSQGLPCPDWPWFHRQEHSRA